MFLKKVPSNAPHELLCPSCEKCVYKVYRNKTEVPGGGYWLQDGDTIPGLYEILTDIQKSEIAFDYELLVGKCKNDSSQNNFYVITAGFMFGEQDDVEEYLFFNKKMDSVTNYICSLEYVVENNLCVDEFILQRFETPLGAMHHFIFGPFMLDEVDNVVGGYGVTACQSDTDNMPWSHAKQLLLSRWDIMRSALHVDDLVAISEMIMVKNASR